MILFFKKYLYIHKFMIAKYLEKKKENRAISV